jgi:hypothetical protein
MSEIQNETEKEVSPLFSEEEQEAAANFAKTFELFMKNLQKIESRASMARVFREAAEFPLGPNKPTFNSKKQEELFLTFLALTEYKSQILTAILQKNNYFNKNDDEQRKSQD